MSTEILSVYTCYIGNNELSEFEYFNDFANSLISDGHKKELYILKSTLNKMQQYGAQKYYFKEEQNAHALPKLSNAQIVELNNPDYGIRLYCIRINENNLVLLNGQIKTKQNPLDCNNVRSHFQNAIRIATKIDQAIFNKEINILEDEDLLELEFEI